MFPSDYSVTLSLIFVWTTFAKGDLQRHYLYTLHMSFYFINWSVSYIFKLKVGFCRYQGKGFSVQLLFFCNKFSVKLIVLLSSFRLNVVMINCSESQKRQHVFARLITVFLYDSCLQFCSTCTVSALYQWSFHIERLLLFRFTPHVFLSAHWLFVLHTKEFEFSLQSNYALIDRWNIASVGNIWGSVWVTSKVIYFEDIILKLDVHSVRSV